MKKLMLALFLMMFTVAVTANNPPGASNFKDGAVCTNIEKPGSII
jgi:hypothetical protein